LLETLDMQLDYLLYYMSLFWHVQKDHIYMKHNKTMKIEGKEEYK